MKLSALQNSRRSNSFRGASLLDSSVDGSIKSPAAIFWLVLHGFCCLISLVLGFRFSRVVFFLLFSSTTTTPPTNLFSTANSFAETLSFHTSPPPNLNLTPLIPQNGVVTSSGVVVGRHGILIRPWPHPNPTEVMEAHRIIERVQQEQRIQFGIKNPRTIIVVTPTYVRTFQTLHLTGVMHSLMLVPYDLTWIVVEAGGKTSETASILGKSGLRSIIHIGFGQRMPSSWEERRKTENQMRLRALRAVRDQKLDGIVMFADDSNMHSLELFDEIQEVKYIGALSVGILVHSGNSDELSSIIVTQKKNEVVGEEDLSMPIQGPACNSSGRVVGWHTFNSLPYEGKSAIYIDDRAPVLPSKLEWSGFVLNSRLLWKDAEDRPEWAKDLDAVDRNGEGFVSPLSLLKDTSVVEPLGSCGRKVMLWWLRVEARADSKFPSGWIIDPPLEMTIPAKRTPWPDAPPELPPDVKVVNVEEHVEKRPTRTRSSRSKHRSKRKHEAKVAADVSAMHSIEN